MNTKYVAIFAAALMTACLGASILAIGGAAFFNPSGGTAASSRAQMSAPAPGAIQQVQLQQLQSLVAQYQGRESQYQAREQQYQQQLDRSTAQVQQARVQMQQIQELLNALQQRGLISVTSDGQIFINQ
jgi:phosphoglycolate phosphatase-like HAD superfamily hydrolase